MIERIGEFEPATAALIEPDTELRRETFQRPANALPTGCVFQPPIYPPRRWNRPRRWKAGPNAPGPSGISVPARTNRLIT
jgi:hypothetical protein